MTFSQKDIQTLFVGNAAAVTTEGMDTMNAGEIGIFTPGGARMTEANAATESHFIIAKKVGTELLVSSKIAKADIKAASLKVGAAATATVCTVGYNGVNGAIDAINDNPYYLRLEMIAGCVNNHGGYYAKPSYFKSDLDTTEMEVANALAINTVNNFSKEASKAVSVDVLSSAAATAFGAGTGTLSIVKGSTKAIASVDATVGVEVGSFVRFGTALTAPVYKVVAVDAGTDTITFDRKVTQDTAVLANSVASWITLANAEAGSCGLRFTGVEDAHVLGKLHNDGQIVNFEISLQDFGSTTNAKVGGNVGSGTNLLVSELEYFCQGNEGDFYGEMGFPNNFSIRKDAVLPLYNLVTITTTEIYAESITAGPINKTFTLAIPAAAGYAVAGSSDDITDVLEVLSPVTASGALAMV